MRYRYTTPRLVKLGERMMEQLVLQERETGELSLKELNNLFVIIMELWPTE